MTLSWDDRVVAPIEREFLRAVQREATCRLSGGAALSGAHLQHRLSRDLDLFCDDRDALRDVVAAAGEAARSLGGSLRIVRNGGSHVRGELTLEGRRLDLDVVHEAAVSLAERVTVEGVTVDSLEDLRANKLTCLLSRSEPRDLVDVYFLEEHGFPPEGCLAAALRKDAGMDPGILSMLLRDFPTTPLPVMLRPLDEPELRRYRDELRERFKRAALP